MINRGQNFVYGLYFVWYTNTEESHWNNAIFIVTVHNFDIVKLFVMSKILWYMDEFLQYYNLFWAR